MTFSSFKATLVTLFLFPLLVATAQQLPVAQFTDPANLRGERVKPRDGRELPIDQGARGLQQMLRKLNTRASLMLIVAHPDDEDGGMLTYYSRGLGARVAMLTLTRGEGGQNAMTGDFEDALGLLRTQELLSADRYLGVDQFFGTEVDFGFSKTKEEAFKKWTHERVLYDAVRSIRLYRPLVIAAVFIGGVTDGHGQHQVSGQIAQEAFKAAADPTVFPDMIAEGILPWQALKVYARVPMQSISEKGLFDYATGKYTAPRFENYVTGEITTTVPSSDVIVHEGTPDPILSDTPPDPPRTYVQFARIGLGMQKSQIGGNVRVPPTGTYDVAYHRYGSKLSKQSDDETSFFDGIDTSIKGLAKSIPGAPTVITGQLGALDDEMRQISDWNSHEDQRARLPELLADAFKRVALVISTLESTSLVQGKEQGKEDVLHELRIKRIQLNDALALALNLSFDATASQQENIAGTSIAIAIRIPNQPSPGTTLSTEFLENAAGKQSRKAVNLPTLEFGSADTQIITRPYFHRDTIEQPFYAVNYPQLRNAPASSAAVVAWASFVYEGEHIAVGRIVHAGEQAVSFVPALNVALSNHAQIVTRVQDDLVVSMAVSPHLVSTHEQLEGPENWTIKPLAAPADAPGRLQFHVHLPDGDRQPATLEGSAALPGGLEYDEGYRSIGYGDLPRTNYFTPAQVRIVPVNLNFPAIHRIAYLPGTGDAVLEALDSINLKPDILTVADLTPAKLAHYDTVILGVRTYNAHPNLHGAPTQALLEYAHNGGNVLLQYQTAEFTGADAPYPLTLGYAAEKVVDETDPVQLLQTSAPFLTTPNQITRADFNNWIEERGHGFLESWDVHYTALTETHDPDQDPQRGGLITTNIGKGRWTYCAFALYRQLPEAVPGAFRLFVNLLNNPTAK